MTPLLYEGGPHAEMIKRAASLVRSGVQMISLLDLDDNGAPGFSQPVAAELAALDVPVFACTPDLFPELMAAISKRDVVQWAASRQIVVSRPS